MALLLAPQCAVCREPLESPTRGPVCRRCWESIAPLPAPVCDRCGEPVASERAARACLRRVEDAASGWILLCPSCRSRPSEVSIGRSAGEYAGALRQVIHGLKYEGRRSLARPLSHMMCVRGADALAGAEIAVPVPLHWRRRMARGFNQSEDLARSLGLPVCRALRRCRATRPQFGLGLAARRRNVAGAFRPRRGWLGSLARDARRVRGACVLLVDDVATTGATLDECAAVMKEIGAREVRTLTAARALRQLP